MKSLRKMKKYPLNSTVDKREIFNYPFITDSTTASYIKKKARVMFIIRGLPYTGKTVISQMLMETYPNAVYCSGVKYLKNLSPKEEITLPKELKEITSKLCREKVEDACTRNERTIIIQNSHIKRFEIQPYLNFAAKYDYTVIMIATNDRFEFTPEALARDNPKGLDEEYLMRRFKGWHDILPMFTGWFISSDDSLYIHNFILKSLEPLLEDYKFCKYFNVGNAEELRKCFHLRKVLSCVAGYFEDPLAMKKYYLSDEVQSSNGKVFSITIVGYLVTVSGIIAIVQVNQTMKSLIPDVDNNEIIFIKNQRKKIGYRKYSKKIIKGPNPKLKPQLLDSPKKNSEFQENGQQQNSVVTEVAQFHCKKLPEGLGMNKSSKKLEVTGEAARNVLNHGKTFHLQGNDYLPQNTSVTLEDWADGQSIDTTRSTFFHLGQRNFDSFDIPKIKKEYESSLKSITDKYGIISDDIFSQLGNELKICRLSENAWLLKTAQIICVKTVFTGFYP